jgi:hypothetical protein
MEAFRFTGITKKEDYGTIVQKLWKEIIAYFPFTST